MRSSSEYKYVHTNPKLQDELVGARDCGRIGGWIETKDECEAAAQHLQLELINATAAPAPALDLPYGCFYVEPYSVDGLPTLFWGLHGKRKAPRGNEVAVCRDSVRCTFAMGELTAPTQVVPLSIC